MQITRSTFYQVIVFHLYILAFYLTLPDKNEWWTTVLLLSLVLILVILEYLRTWLFVSPMLLWYVFWLGAISIGRMDLDLYPMYRTWESDLIKLVLINTCAFFWFFWIGELISQRKEQNERITTQSIHGLADITIFMLLSALLCYALNVIKTGYIPMLTSDANSYREAFVRTVFYKIISAMRVSFVLAPAALKYEENRIKKNGLIVLALLLMFAEALSGWRTYIFQAMIFSLTPFFVIYGQEKAFSMRKRNLIVLLISSVVGLTLIGLIAVTRETFSGSLKEKAKYLFYTIYMYIAPNFLNLQYAIENVEPINLPVYSTEAIWGFFLNRDAIMFQFGENDQAIGGFNVSTYMLQPWADFGRIGTIVWSAFIAFCSGVVFKKCRHYPGIVPLVLVGMMNISIFVMHNNLFFRTKTVVIWLFAALAIEMYIRKKERYSWASQSEH